MIDQFSDTFQHKLNNALNSTYKAAPVDEARWAILTAQEKITELDSLAKEFIEQYDSDALIHHTTAYPDDTVVSMKFVPFENEYGEVADYAPEDNITFYFRAYVLKDGEYDLAGSKSFYDDIMAGNIEFDVDQTLQQDSSYHVMYSHAKRNHVAGAQMGQHVDSISKAGHESVHLILDRMANLYAHDPYMAEKKFGYTADDYALHQRNKAHLAQSDDHAHYMENQEEVFARNIQANIATALKNDKKFN